MLTNISRKGNGDELLHLFGRAAGGVQYIAISFRLVDAYKIGKKDM